jgi:Mn-containing catalase
VFSHIHELQFDATPDAPDPAFARRFQEVLGGKWGEMTVALQYLYQGWNCRLPGKYKDMLLDIGTEELAHVEMITTMIDRLLDSSPLSEGRPPAGDARHAAGPGPEGVRDVQDQGGRLRTGGVRARLVTAPIRA